MLTSSLANKIVSNLATVCQRSKFVVTVVFFPTDMAILDLNDLE